MTASNTIRTKRSKKSPQNFRSYVVKVHKSIHPEMGISLKAMNILNALVVDIFGRIAYDASLLVK